MNNKILIVEDEKNLGVTLSEYLNEQGYITTLCESVGCAIDQLNKTSFDVALLDIGLPDGSGLELGRLIKGQFPHTQILFLSAQNSPDIKLEGLELGAIDYITKPFRLKELLIRLNKYRGEKKVDTLRVELSEFTAGTLSIDFKKFTLVNGGGDTINLGVKENGILRALCERANEVLPREELIEKIWGEDSFPSNRTVDNYIVKLRKWLEPNSSELEIQNVRGVGYKLVIK